LGGDPQKSHPRYYPHLAARHVAKSHETTFFGSKDPLSNTLHFKAIFNFPLKNVVRRSTQPARSTQPSYSPRDGEMSSNSFIWVTEVGTFIQLTGVA